jgi:hypothetical protein
VRQLSISEDERNEIWKELADVGRRVEELRARAVERGWARAYKPEELEELEGHFTPKKRVHGLKDQQSNAGKRAMKSKPNQAKHP